MTAHPPPAAARPLDVAVVPHTHWDREWYHEAGRFRQRLVALVDELLDDDRLDGRPDGESFLLDGQAIVLEDYLAVRPERRDALAGKLAAGALEAGPWYVLADELLPSGEALVRNLLTGRRALRALGAAAPPVLYSPDAFGHAAAMPALAAGFGLVVAVAWRGYGGARWPAGDTAWWRAPGGERVLLAHLPRDGYEVGSSLPVAPDAATERWARLREELAPRAALGFVLLPNGADHHARQAAWRDAVRALGAAAAPDRVRAGSLAAWAAELARRADGAALPEVAGELRDSYGYTWTLQGTFATRAAQKRRNARVERLLLRDVEPWLALLALRGEAAGARRRALLDAAWRTLLRCHPHDTLCGCSVDAVARAMDARLDDALAQGRGLRDDALCALVGHDAGAARERRDAWRRAVVVRNRAARPRGGVAEVELLTFLRDVPVGPGSAGRVRHARVRGAPVALDGGRVMVQVLERAVRHERIESPRHYPDDDLVEAARAVAWLPPVAALGTVGLALDERGDAEPRDGPTHPVRTGDATLDNGLLAVTVDTGGRVRLRAPALGVDVASLLRFEDVGDVGDLYTPSLLGAPLSAAWFGGARTLHRGPLRGALELRYRLRVPDGALSDDEEPLARPSKRGRRHVELPLTVRLVLDADAPFLRVEVEGENRARDHRLRVVLATGVAQPRVLADAALGPVWRTPLHVSAEERAVEAPPPTAPLHRYVSLYGARVGATVFGDGLAEYEATPAGDVAVTLLRAVGELSRGDLPERPGHAGWPAATPEAQCPGPFAARLALAFHDARDDAARALVEALADDVLLPLTGATLRAALAVPAPTSGVALEGEGLVASAVAPAERDGWAVLRCVNVREQAVRGRWRLPGVVREARLARLDETLGAALDVADGAVAFEAGPRAVVTVMVRGAP